MKIACRCGKALAARPELAGKKVKCPACGARLTVPAAAGGSCAKKCGAPLVLRWAKKPAIGIAGLGSLLGVALLAVQTIPARLLLIGAVAGSIGIIAAFIALMTLRIECAACGEVTLPGFMSEADLKLSRRAKHLLMGIIAAAAVLTAASTIRWKGSKGVEPWLKGFGHHEKYPLW